MATRFELLLYGEDRVRLRAAGEEAIGEIERLEKQLSFYDPASDINAINARAAYGPVRIEPRLFELLAQAREVNGRTEGAFDITIGPLMRVWGLAGGSGRVPEDGEIAAALKRMGMGHVRLDGDSRTISFDRPGVELDLGAIGKGYAIERACELLRENGVRSAFLHGGTSTICGIGHPPDQKGWKVGVRAPGGEGLVDTVDLCDSSLSVSAVHGKSFTLDGKEYGHLIDPRTGKPVGHTLLAAVWGPSPTLTDALSTALLVLGKDWIPMLGQEFPGYQGVAISR